MKIIRFIASLLTFGPIGGLLGFVFGNTKVLQIIMQANSEHEVEEQLESAVGIALGSVAIATLCFLVGATIHFIVARRSQVYPHYVWRLIFFNSIVFLLLFPLGTVLGGITLALLFSLQTFKKMRTVEQAPRLVPSKAAADDGL